MQMTAGAPSIRSVVLWIGKTCVLFGFSVALWAFPTDAQAQHEPLRIQPLSPAAQTERGIQLVKRDRTDEALSSLQPAFAARPALYLPDHGAAAYWLGTAYAGTGDSAQARTTWRRGYHRLADAGRFDVRLADAYLRSLSENTLRNERLEAVEAYVTLLGRVEPDTSAALQTLFRRRIAQIAPLMPDDVFGRVVEGKRSAEPATWTIRAEAGQTLRSWWRGLDPFPATDENERLEEHLTRLVHARQSFSCPDRPSALGDRGLTYLRYGPPYKRRTLSYKDGDFFREVFRFGVSVSSSSFPESEIWLYSQIDESGVYLFAEEETSDCFHVATANDLLPSTLKRYRGNSERGLNIAYSSLMAMRAIYGELALYHPSFSSRYSEIDNYAGRQEMKAAAAEMAEMAGEDPGSGSDRSVEVGAGVGQTRRVFSNPNLELPFPNRFVSRMVSRAEREDAATARRRKKNMPRQYTALHGDTPRLPVAVRTARFLNEDGTTRTEVYWGVTTSAARLQPDEENEAPAPSMIRFSAAQHNHNRSQTKRQNRYHQLSSDPTQQGPAFAPTPVTFESTSRHHLTMTWTQHRLWQTADSAVSGVGPKRRFALVRADSLAPLRAEGPLEVSDLKVLASRDTTLQTLANPTESATPYPFQTITPDTPLLLVFDVYHLMRGADDRTNYTVSYEVKGKTRRGSWGQLLRGQDTQRTSTTMTRTGSSRRSEERILLDLSEIEREEAQDVRVTVRVRDEETETSVTRSLDFVLRPDAD